MERFIVGELFPILMHIPNLDQDGQIGFFKARKANKKVKAFWYVFDTLNDEMKCFTFYLFLGIYIMMIGCNLLKSSEWLRLQCIYSSADIKKPYLLV